MVTDRTGGAGRPDPTMSREDYPRNAAGQTFGSGAQARTPAYAPDLILSLGARNERGYVRRTDLEGEQPRTPAQAIALTERRRREGPTNIPLYAEDGETVIGSFLLG